MTFAIQAEGLVKRFGKTLAVDGVDLAARIAAPDAREGIARVAFAEAGNQGDSGLAAVIYTILNRLADGRWGPTIDAVLNAPHQFEPVMRAGGDWRQRVANVVTVREIGP